jgi:glycosyltransferase involved in cell wall biosynthesis
VKISVITPSFNQAAYIERTLASIHGQRGPFELEHIVVDGGSTDGTPAILARHGDRLRWVSEPDEGQSDAIDKGLRMATGDILAWLNSDDVYRPDALAQVAAAYRAAPFLWCFGNCRIIDEHDREIRPAITRYKIRQSRRYSYRRLLRRDFIPQPSTFFTRAAVEAAGEISRSLTYSMDYDYWLRLGRLAPPRYLDTFLADFRWHTQSKNGAAYRAAARETLHTARRLAPPGSAFDLSLHTVHYWILCILYRFL